MMCLFGKFKIERAACVLILMSVLVGLLPATAAAVQSVTFGWEPSADPSVAGYNIYYGTVSQVYASKVAVGNMTTATISNLVEGQTYYFAATTYDVLNQESVFSDEISYTVPLPVTNPPPVITQIPVTMTGIAGQSVTSKVMATGEGPLIYSLGPDAPAGAVINPNTGLFVWSPAISQASTTNVITVMVTDSGTPQQSTTQTFTVIVQDYIHVSIASAVVATNSAGGLALAVYASTSITNLQFVLDYPPDRLTNFFIAGTNSLVGAASAAPIAQGQILITVTTGAGQTMLGAQTLGTIGFQSIAASKTEYAYLGTEQAQAGKADGTLANQVTADQARVTVVGQDSMIEAQLAGGVRSLIVYGPTGAGYQIESCNALGGSGGWVGVMNPITMTNLSQTILLPPDTNSATFYRTRKTQ